MVYVESEAYRISFLSKNDCGTFIGLAVKMFGDHRVSLGSGIGREEKACGSGGGP